MTKNSLICVAAATALCLGAALHQSAFAAASAAEAAQLKTTLTPFGAERAGNADGSIPAWTGGWTTVPAGFKSGDVLPDLFASEKPVLTITNANLGQYKDKIPAGVLQLFAKYPEYRMDVYPTHRTAAAPQYVYDNTFANATRATTINDGLGIQGAYGGVPFPIPKTGREVIWNHELRWTGYSYISNIAGYIRTASGDLVEASLNKLQTLWPYYDPNGSLQSFRGIYKNLINSTYDPTFNAGQAVLEIFPVDQTDGDKAWEYLIGQRRVRKAPNIAYDTPNFFLSGLAQFDDTSGFDGALDRYDFKIVGKAEYYVPYNDQKWVRNKIDVQLLPHYPNPDILRWELHRVWIVDLTLAPGKRNDVAKRRFYVDEDTWQILASDEYDGAGQLWRLILDLPIVVPDFPAVVAGPSLIMDFHNGAYGCGLDSGPNWSPQYLALPKPDDSYFTSANLANLGVE